MPAATWRGGLVGIRTRATTRSDAAWAAGHRAAERPARWCAVVCAVSTVVLLGLALAGGSEQVVLIAAAVGGLAAVVALVLVTRRANAAAVGAEDDSSRPG
ncbi:SdpI family protein [Kineococcus sp. GCM10028916]|uniref:SdpI family protein n=1 Tax=Kineococcus sp. GCM10028916 TaxID=3273394 RepID=UPI003627C062